MPEGMRFFQYLSSILEPLRLRDFHSHVRALGLPEFHPPVAVSSPLPFLAALVRHRSESVGAIYVGEKQQEFTTEDEETWSCSPPKRRWSSPTRADTGRSSGPGRDLETLVNTAPVGVLVFGARTGNPVSVNQEARGSSAT